MKRIFDFVLSLILLTLAGPILIIFALLVFLQDLSSPLYIAERVGRAGKPFRMYKLRSMIVGADKSGVDSTGNGDIRITTVGRLIRKFKLDELTQLLNVLKGDMSLVGPRPNVSREVNLYTEAELCLLQVRPGITDFASIVFADEGEILAGSRDPDLDYNRLIRPLKSELGIFYVKKKVGLVTDFLILGLTAAAIIDRKFALSGVCKILRILGAEHQLVQKASRNFPLKPEPPPGSTVIVETR